MQGVLSMPTGASPYRHSAHGVLRSQDGGAAAASWARPKGQNCRTTLPPPIQAPWVLRQVLSAALSFPHSTTQKPPL